MKRSFIDPEKQVLCHFIIIKRFSPLWLLLTIFIFLLFFQLLIRNFIKYDQNLAEDQIAWQRDEIVHQNLIKITHVSLLREAHFSVSILAAKILNERQHFFGTLHEDISIHQSYETG